MPNNRRIAELIAKERQEMLSEGERSELQTWINASATNRWWYEEMANDENIIKGIISYEKAAEKEDEALLKVIPQKEWSAGQVVRLVKRRLIMRIAVAAILLVGVGIAVSEYHSPAKKGITLAAGTEIVHDLPPGGNKAILTLANGSAIILDSVHSGSLVQQGGTQIVKLDSGRIAYSNLLHEKPKEALYNTLATPPGGQYQIVLPDGSKVWLNAASTLRYPTAFAGATRSVELTGEGYFEIAKNSAQPFIVKIPGSLPESCGMQINVLGTKFDIMAYREEHKMKATLLDGSVKVLVGDDQVLLKPGQQAEAMTQGTSLGNNASIHILREVDTEKVVAWKNGYFEFDNDDLQSVMRQLARWYNVAIVYQGSKPVLRLTGVISRNNNASDLLSMLQVEGANLKIEGKKIVVSQ